jgi:DNA-directed RNA polymerase beta subunit
LREPIKRVILWNLNLLTLPDLQTALDYIGKRGNSAGAVREKRIKYAREILQKEFLPHVGTEEFCETKKAYFFGYVIHRLLLCALGRRAEDDRDHYGNKRLDLAGPLMGGLFRLVRGSSASCFSSRLTRGSGKLKTCRPFSVGQRTVEPSWEREAGLGGATHGEMSSSVLGLQGFGFPFFSPPLV